jgi:hypothetical protein
VINKLLRYKKPLLWVLLHVLLGFLSAFSKFPIIVYFYVFLITSLLFVFDSKDSQIKLTMLMAYLIPMEIICRMAQTSPFVPYELSKYLFFILLIFGLLTNTKKSSKIGFFLLLLLLPAFFYDRSYSVTSKDLVFNLLAPVNLCLAVWYFYKRPIKSEYIPKLIIVMVLPLISALAYTVIKTPDYDQIEFILGANFDTTGGFGSNQVSTIFGLGLFLTFYLWYNRMTISGLRILDGGIVFLFTFQGLLSFSRGGMIGGAVAILLYLLFNKNIDTVRVKSTKKNSKFLIPALALVLISVFFANEVTKGQLLLRYQGETAGTLAGAKEKDLNSITTRRSSIFEGDFQLFKENLLGVGAGASKYLRETENGFLTHVEFSRLLAEHGVLGLLFFLVFSLLPFFLLRKQYSSGYRGLLIALFFIAWYTSFHAATRNFVTPLLGGLALINVVKQKNKVLELVLKEKVHIVD